MFCTFSILQQSILTLETTNELLEREKPLPEYCGQWYEKMPHQSDETIGYSCLPNELVASPIKDHHIEPLEDTTAMTSKRSLIAEEHLSNHSFISLGLCALVLFCLLMWGIVQGCRIIKLKRLEGYIEAEQVKFRQKTEESNSESDEDDLDDKFIREGNIIKSKFE